jgi:hypothetical protein
MDIRHFLGIIDVNILVSHELSLALIWSTFYATTTVNPHKILYTKFKHFQKLTAEQKLIFWMLTVVVAKHVPHFKYGIIAKLTCISTLKIPTK